MFKFCGMRDVIIVGDDEVDLCRQRASRRGMKNTALLVNAIFIIFIGVIFQQYTALQRQGFVAHAQTDAQDEHLCAYKDNFLQTLPTETIQTSLVTDEACIENQIPVASVPVTPLEEKLHRVVDTYPMEAMIPAMAKQDPVVAAFLVGIAKKESDWGKHVPRKFGEDCFNYWGYKGAGGRGSALGYACFASPEEAVQVVGTRLFTLAKTQHRDTPSKMLVWKCGSSCAGHDPKGVASWVGTVETYYKKVL